METFLKPHEAWIEAMTGGPRSETFTFEFDFPVSHMVVEDLMAGVALDRQCLNAADALRQIVRKWELPPRVSPRMELHASRDRTARITGRSLAWDPHWGETPIAIWFDGHEHAIVSANIPVVMGSDGRVRWRQCLIVNRREAATNLNLLRQIAPERRKITVVGGGDVLLPDDGYNWDSVVLESDVGSVRDDFETFWESESWFADKNLPYRRGFLLYGPPGNGKTSTVRVMACHPLVSAFSIDFSSEDLPNYALAELFESAEDNAPAVVILEDLDRMFGADRRHNRARVTVPHLLACLDGLAKQNGIVVVATANDPSGLDPAILKRPGRFDRLVEFALPSMHGRCDYIAKLTGWGIDEPAVSNAAREADRLSFAQIREAYILAGQRSFRRNGDLVADELLAAIRALRSEFNNVSLRPGGRSAGFN
jgi:hypothetical protein